MRTRSSSGGDKVGQAGVEAAFDRYLRGTAGLQRLLVDSLGQPRSDFTPLKTPMPGNNITLTIDVGLQYAAERALEHGIRIARDSQCTGGCWNANGGAVVALDARNGEVLALASNPTFDPRIFVGKPNPWRIRPLVNEVSAKRNNYPGLNRALAGVYPPGSTFKPVTAIAALEEQIVQPYEPQPCTPSYTYVGENGVLYKFDNWNPYTNTAITMPIALAWSCDTYFYRLGEEFYNKPTSPLQEWASRFGFGKPTGIELGPEATGLVPTPKWRRDTYKDPIERLWKPGDSIQLTIGQKDMTATPLQMARFYAMVANGGRLVTPHLFKDVQGPGQLSIVPHPTPPSPERIKVSPAALSVVREGLYPRDARPGRDVDRRLLVVPGRDRGQDRNGREVLERVRPDVRPGLVVRLRPRRRRRDRRVRARRERRPRRHGGRARRARRLREVLQEGHRRDQRRVHVGDGLSGRRLRRRARPEHGARRVEAGAEAFARNFDWILFGAVAALVGYGLHLVAGITRDDVAGNPDYYVVRQAIYAAVGGIAMVGVSLLDPDVFRATGASSTRSPCSCSS